MIWTNWRERVRTQIDVLLPADVSVGVREEEKVDEEAALRAKDIEKKRRQGMEIEYEL